MAEWDFESALKDYFGASTEDGDAPLGAGSATFSAPGGWDFDKALNDYFGGVNGYVAPSTTVGPPPLQPPPPPPPPPAPRETDDIERWWQSPEGREMFRAPFAAGPEFVDVYTPRERAWQEVRQEQERRSSNPFIPPRPSPQDIFNRWLTGASGDLNRWLGNFLPTPEEEELLRYLPFIAPLPYGTRAVGNLFAPVGAANEWARQNVPNVALMEDIPGNVLNKFVAPLGAANEWARGTVQPFASAEDIAGNVLRTLPDLPLYAPWGRPYDPSADLRANYPGIEPWALQSLAQNPTTVRLPGNMPHVYGGQDQAPGFTLPSPMNSITLGVEPGKQPSLSNELHEAAHAMSFREFGGFAPAWEGPRRDFQRRFYPEWDPFIDAVQNYQGNSSPQYDAVNSELMDKPSATKKGAYAWTNPMEAYARIAELSQGDLSRIPAEFRKFYTWLGRKERVREPP